MSKPVVRYKKPKMPRPSTSTLLRFTFRSQRILPTLQMAALYFFETKLYFFETNV